MSMRALLLLTFLVSAKTSALPNEIIKLTTTNQCHDSTSRYYENIKNYKSYLTIEKCIEAGGVVSRWNEKTLVPPMSNQYNRKYFGHGWLDTDGDCQNTRAEQLVDMNTGNLQYKNGDRCLVTRGRWLSMYTGNILFNASDVDIDHLVPLKWAWTHGATEWTDIERKRFANDPRNLLVVENYLNRAKGAKGVDQWLPPKNACEYVLRFQRITKIYGLRFGNELEMKAIEEKCND